MKLIPHRLLMASWLVTSLGAAPVNPAGERIREGEVKQVQLRSEAQGLVDQLDAMLDEYTRNALSGEDEKLVKAIRGSIAQLSGTEMKQIVEFLGKARDSGDGGLSKKELSAAYTGQKALITQMKKLLADHLRKQQATELSQQLNQLADRQAVNLQSGISLGSWDKGRKPENFEAAIQANMEGQQAEQTAIAAEMKLIGESIGKFAQDPANLGVAERLMKGMEALQKVQPNAEAAADALKQAQLFKAVAEEKVTRDALRRLAREIAPPQDRADGLRAAEREVAKLIEEEKEIIKQTAKAVGEKDFDKWVDQQIEQKQIDAKLAKQPREALQKNKDLQRRFQEQRGGRPEDLGALEDKQADVAGKNDATAQKLEGDLPAAARSMNGAHEKIQEARGAMAEKNPEAALKNSREALAGMEAAETKIQAEIAKVDAAAGKIGDLVKDLAQLQKAAGDLAKQEAAAARNPDKAGQAAIAEAASQLAAQAAKMAPQAAASMNQAAAKAAEAAAAAQAKQPAAAQAAQQAAAEELAKAEKQIGEELAEAAQEKQALAAAVKGGAELAGMIIAEQKLEMDTGKGLALVLAKKMQPAAAFAGQSPRQQEIRGNVDAFTIQLAPELSAAAPALSEATASMSVARMQLDQSDGAGAKAAELKALAALYRAQKVLTQIAEKAKEALAENNPAAEANAQQQAQAQVAQAQAAAAQASEDIKKAQAAEAAAAAAEAAGNKPAAAAAAAAAAASMKKAAGELAQAAQKAGEAAAQGMPSNPAAAEAAAAGEAAAAEAAAAAAAADAPAAAAAAAAAEGALAAAQAAMAEAQSGITAAGAPPSPGGPPAPGEGPPGEGPPGEGPPGEGPPGEGPPGEGPPGSKPGSKPGKGPGKGVSKSAPPPGQPGSGAEKYEPGGGGEGVDVAKRATAAKKAAFAALPPRERAVIEQSQSEKYPEEFGLQVEQYLLNLATEGRSRK